MELILGNPAGWWALLGVPVILAIHFLQSRTRRVETSTLFLLEELARESVRGSLWERLRLSPLLFLQLLAVLLLTWLLLEPRWLRPDSFQQTIFVLDSSVSVRPFLDAAHAAVRREAGRLERAAARSEWIALESDLTRGMLYRGSDARALLAAVDAWRPRSGHHDFGPALELARDLRRPKGGVVLVTDRRPEALPPGVDLLAVGGPFDNAGFAGLRVEKRDGRVEWSAVLRNYGAAPVARRWTLASGGRTVTEGDAALEPGAAVVLRGQIPPGVTEARLSIPGDRFALDDRAPLVVPEPKPLAVLISGPEACRPLADRLLGSLESAARDASGRPDFALWFLRAGAPAPPGRPGVFLAYQETPADKLRAGPVVADRHPWMNGLSWQGLLAREGPALAATNGETVLLWQGAHPLIFARERGGARQLVFNFDVLHANLDRLPAFVLLVRRFVEDLRADKPALERRNAELQQTLAVAADPGGGPLELSIEGRPAATVDAAGGAATLRAPEEPAAFAVRQGRASLLEAAAHFSDAREADFRAAGSEDTTGGRAREVTLANSRREAFTPLWLVLLAAVLLGAWALAEKTSGASPGAPAREGGR